MIVILFSEWMIHTVLEEWSKKEGIKPIIGCEVYVASRTRHDKVKGLDSTYDHLVLLCKNETGYKNLIKMVSLAHTEGFYYKPRVDYEVLKEYSSVKLSLTSLSTLNILSANFIPASV